jgi:hypothetical protein
MPAKPIDQHLRMLEGKFGWAIHGFLEASPFFQPELRHPQPEPPDGPFQNPSVIFGYRPPEADLKTPLGYYPYSEAGYVDFKEDGTFTGVYRFNVGGNSVPWDISHQAHGEYNIVGDGTGTLLFLDDNDAPIVQMFMVIIDPADEMLLTVTWINRTVHHRGTGMGTMKRLR